MGTGVPDVPQILCSSDARSETLDGKQQTAEEEERNV